MSLRSLFALVLCLRMASLATAGDEGGWRFEIDSEDQPRIRFDAGDRRSGTRNADRIAEHDLSGLKTALEQYEKSGGGRPLTSLPFFDYFHHPNVQDELLAQFQKDHPDLLSYALDSAGNMHNPKVLPLMGKFEETLLKTPTFIEIERLLGKVDHSIDDFSFEKFFIDRKGEKPRFFAVVWIRLKRGP